MREAVEKPLVDIDDEGVDFVALNSVKDQPYSLYRTTGTMLQEVVGYDCEGLTCIVLPSGWRWHPAS
jgi:hypothetical protein